MTKASVLDINGKEKSKMDLPMVFSEKDLAGIMPGTGIAVRVKANIGRAKRKQIVRKALEMSLKVLNP